MSIVSCKDRNLISRSANICSWSVKCRMDRPNRSSLQTMRVSPAGSGRAEKPVEFGAVLEVSRHGVDEHALAAGLIQGVALQAASWSLVETRA